MTKGFIVALTADTILNSNRVSRHKTKQNKKWSEQNVRKLRLEKIRFKQLATVSQNTDRN